MIKWIIEYLSHVVQFNYRTTQSNDSGSVTNQKKPNGVSSRIEQRKLEKKKTLTREVNELKYESSLG
jgi:hypothetical protein